MHGRTIVQRILRDHFRDYWANRRLPERVLTAANALLGCRTLWFGARVQGCPDGHTRTVEFNSCQHRACLRCAYARAQQWAAKQLAKLPDCAYSHVTFTLPDTLRPLWAYNRRWFTTAMFRCAWRSVRQMLADPRHLGALPGAVASFQSWNDALETHPHIHMLLTHGGMTPQGEWKESTRSHLLPPRALAALFRGKLRAELLAAIERGELKLPSNRGAAWWRGRLNKLGRRKWRVQVMPRYAHGQGVVKYLTRYMRGGPVRASQVLRYDGQRLRLRPKNHPDRILELTAEEFLDRFFVHVPERGSHLIRAYGLLHHAKREQLQAVRAQLGQWPYVDPGDLDWQAVCAKAAEFGGRHPERCPVCGQRLIVLRRIPAGRSPPLVKYAA